MQDFLESDPDGSVRIALDQREPAEFDALLESMGAKVERRMLEAGDFICSARLAVERKTRADFEQSVIDGRLFSQLPNLLANYGRVLVLVEGVSDGERLSRSSLLGAYSAIIADFGSSLMFTRDMRSSAEMIYNLARHEQIAKRNPMRIYARRKALTMPEVSRSLVESLPMVGPKSARSLLSRFGSAENVFSASERELSDVPGIGRKRALVIRKALSYHYQEGSA